MSETGEELTAAAQAVSPQPAPSSTPDVEFRRDLAFLRTTSNACTTSNDPIMTQQPPRSSWQYFSFA